MADINIEFLRFFGSGDIASLDLQNRIIDAFKRIKNDGITDNQKQVVKLQQILQEKDGVDKWNCFRSISHCIFNSENDGVGRACFMHEGVMWLAFQPKQWNRDAEVERLNKEIASLKSESYVEELKATIGSRNDDVKHLKEIITKKNIELKLLNEKCELNVKEIEQMKNQLTSTKQLLEQLRSENSILIAEYKNFRKFRDAEMERLNKEIASMKTRNNELEATMKTQNEEVKQLKEIIAKKDVELELSETKHELKYVKEVEQLKGQLIGIKQLVEQLRSDKKNLIDENKNFREELQMAANKELLISGNKNLRKQLIEMQINLDNEKANTKFLQRNLDRISSNFGQGGSENDKQENQELREELSKLRELMTKKDRERMLHDLEQDMALAKLDPN